MSHKFKNKMETKPDIKYRILNIIYLLFNN